MIDAAGASRRRGAGEWFLYAPAAQVNEATRYYIETIAIAGRRLGRELRHVASIAELPDDADVLTVECKSAYRLRFARPGSRVWIWIQGVTPEEARLQFGSRLREMLWNHFERRTLHRAAGLVMVSDAMRAHYAAKHGLGSRPTFVMPCVNAEIDPASFSVHGKYERPTFVYAGSLHEWQCFDLTLATFGLVKARCPAATLTVLTADREGARRAVASSGLVDVDIDFCPLDRLPARLAQYKYGFVLRKPHVVNAVATPTKVSTYMAAGVIPVMTTAVHDYATVLRDVRPIVLSDVVDARAIAGRLLDLESQAVGPDDVLRAYQAVFDSYFARSRYVEPLAEFLGATGLGGA